MCIWYHENFFHNCGHVQLVTIPSANPACQAHQTSTWYHTSSWAEDKHTRGEWESGWCPRCYRGPLLSCTNYTVLLTPSQHQRPCRHRDISTPTSTITADDQVTFPAHVTLWPNPALADSDAAAATATRWAQRACYLLRWNDYLNITFVSRQLALRAREAAAQIPIHRRTYFLRHEPDLYPADPWLYFPISRAAMRAADAVVVDELCLCGFLVPFEDIPSEGEEEEEEEIEGQPQRQTQKCLGGPPVSMPCDHIFGRDCIRAWVEEHGHTACPTCAAAWQVIYIDTEYPPGWQAARARYLEAQQRGGPSRWERVVSRYWQLKVLLFVCIMSGPARVLYPAPAREPAAELGWLLLLRWTSPGGFLFVFLGALAYAYAITAPVKALAGVDLAMMTAAAAVFARRGHLGIGIAVSLLLGAGSVFVRRWVGKHYVWAREWMEWVDVM
jgi:hypothetical protein